MAVTNFIFSVLVFTMSVMLSEYGFSNNETAPSIMSGVFAIISLIAIIPMQERAVESKTVYVKRLVVTKYYR